MRSKCSKILWNDDNNNLRRFFLGLIRAYLDEKDTSSKCNTLAAHPACGVWLSFVAERRRYLADH